MKTKLSRRDVGRIIAYGSIGLIAAPRLGLAAVVARPMLDFAIAGGAYYELARELKSLSLRERLRLRAEPDNPYDPDAVAVERNDGAKLGYVPRSANGPVAFLLREGETLEAEIVGWLGVEPAREPADDVVFTSYARGEPRIRLTLIEAGGWSMTS